MPVNNRQSRPGLRRRHSCTCAFVSILACCTARCDGDSTFLPFAAFLHGHGSLRRTATTSQHALHELPPLHRDDANRQLSESDLPDRRACLASLTFGAGAMIKSGAASAKESNKSERDLLTTLTSPSKHDNLQPDGMVNDAEPTSITLPLEPASGGTFCVRFTVFASDDGPKRTRNLEDSLRLYRAIVDTGSPYLVLPSFGPETKKRRFPGWTNTASASNQAMSDSPWLSSSEYPPTEEIYGAVKGQINWKLSRYEFRDPRLQIRTNGNGGSQNLSHTNTATVGVLDDALTDEATGGGTMKPYALLGLIQSSNPNADKTRFPDPRPSFLEQQCITNSRDETTRDSEEYQIKSFSINGPDRELTLSTQSIIPDTTPAMPLVDLRTVGDFVDHYAVVVNSISFDGISVTSQILKEFSGSPIDRPIVAVFDTGLTGCLMIRPFWDVMQKFMGAKNATLNDLRSVSMSLKGSKDQKGRSTDSSDFFDIKSSLEEDPRFYVQPIDLDWFDDEQYSPYIIVLGQTFLSRGALTIDMGKRIATFN